MRQGRGLIKNTAIILFLLALSIFIVKAAIGNVTYASANNTLVSLGEKIVFNVSHDDGDPQKLFVCIRPDCVGCNISGVTTHTDRCYCFNDTLTAGQLTCSYTAERRDNYYELPFWVQLYNGSDEESGIVQGNNTFGINVTPYKPVLWPVPSRVSGMTVNVIGYVNMTSVNITVFAVNGTVSFSNTTYIDYNSTYYGSSTVESRLKGQTTVLVPAAGANLFEPNRWMRFEFHNRTYFKGYKITERNPYDAHRHSITFAPALEQGVSNGESVYVYDMEYPKGWFNISVNVSDGANDISTVAVSRYKTPGEVSDTLTVTAFHNGMPLRIINSSALPRIVNVTYPVWFTVNHDLIQQIRLVVCKEADCSGCDLTSQTGCYCVNLTGSTKNLTCNYTARQGDSYEPTDYWLRIYNNTDSSSDILKGNNTFRVNHAPERDYISIREEIVGNHHIVICEAITPGDPDNSSEIPSAYYNFSINGILTQTGEKNFFNCSDYPTCRKLDNIGCSVRLVDRHGFFNQEYEAHHNWTRISNLEPTPPKIELYPLAPNTSSNLVCNVTEHSTDPDGDMNPVNYSFHWYRNSVLNMATPKSQASHHTLLFTNTTDGDSWTCVVRAWDGFEYGLNSTENTKTVRVGNHTPMAPVLWPIRATILEDYMYVIGYAGMNMVNLTVFATKDGDRSYTNSTIVQHNSVHFGSSVANYSTPAGHQFTWVPAKDHANFRVGRYIGFSGHNASNFRMYLIVSKTQMNADNYRLNLDRGVETAVDQGETIDVYSAAYPHGWFNISVRLFEGWNNITAMSRSFWEINSPGTQNMLVLADTKGPEFNLSMIPNQTDSNRPNITFTVRDDAGVEIDSVFMDVKKGAATESRLSEFSCSGNDVFYACWIQPYLADGRYNLSFSAQDTLSQVGTAEHLNFHVNGTAAIAQVNNGYVLNSIAVIGNIATTNTLFANWTNAITTYDIEYYQYAVGTGASYGASGWNSKSGWTNISLNRSVNRTFSLVPGTAYYFHVRAKLSNNEFTQVTSSRGIMFRDPTPPVYEYVLDLSLIHISEPTRPY